MHHNLISRFVKSWVIGLTKDNMFALHPFMGYKTKSLQPIDNGTQLSLDLL
jgi:hypothetical protein